MKRGLRERIETALKRYLNSIALACAGLLLAQALPGLAASPAPAPPAGMVNLVQGKAYSVTSLVSTEYSFAPSEAKFFVPGALTDGEIGSSSTYKDGQWQGFLHGGSRSVVIDMGGVNTVHQLQERFIQPAMSGVYFPREVTFALSMNDTDWAVVGKVDTRIPLTDPVAATQAYAVSGLDYQARYVKMTFTVDVWVFADEFQVFGDTGVTARATVPTTMPEAVYPDAYLAPGSQRVGGVKNLVLIYNGYYPTNPAIGKSNVTQLTPYVGYQNTSGRITDYMFDGFLFLPFVAAGAPSGGKYYCDTAHPTVMSDWTYYLDNTFDSTCNLSSLNSAVGNVKRILNDPSYKAKVEIAIPYPTPTATDFGDVLGTGTSENLSRLSDREAVLKWYIGEVLTRWNTAAYKNLNLVGFYWYEEGADFDVDDSEAVMLKTTGNYVRSLGKVFNWIPAYQASGFAEWDSLGFDAAVLQPNFVFDNFQVYELGEAADAAKKLGMGVELEIHWDALTDSTYRTKYYDYLDYGATKGYMTDAVHMYYQNGGPGTFYSSCISTDPQVREIYDATYEFIKGTYSGSPTGVNEPAPQVPRKMRLGENYPNPFNPETVIRVGLARKGMMSLKIYNVLGQLVDVVDQGYRSPGEYVYDVDMKDFASGVYFYALRQDGDVASRKMLLLK